MIIPVLAIKNIFRAGIRTWLNAFVLSLSFVMIIWMQGIYQGMNYQASRAMIDEEYAGGQYWHKNYDSYDPFTIDESHGKIPQNLSDMINQNKAAAILISRGMIYKGGRVMPVLLKGINPEQKILDIPTATLIKREDGVVPVLIGTRMAKSSGLRKGNIFTLQWRDSKGAFDARDFVVAEVMKTSVQSIDNNQLWMPVDDLRKMFKLPEKATIIVIRKGETPEYTDDTWKFKSQDFLLSDIRRIVQAKTISASIFYFVLLFLAMIAIFDTQILSIFKRKKEIGTLMALGMTRSKVIALFTFEGAAYSIIALFLAVVYGTPIMILTATKGWALPQGTDSYGIALGDKLFPVYSFYLVIGTIVIILTVTTIVSYLPARRIAKLKPTQALRGNIT